MEAKGPPGDAPRTGQDPVRSEAGEVAKRVPPERPPVEHPSTAPVLVTSTPPFSIRLAQFFWIFSFAVGGFTVVYYFVIRETQLPLIADLVRTVVEGRSDQTYETAADIVFWVLFGIMVAILLVQITLLVSFMSRRPKVRWWQLATLAIQGLVLLLARELVALGDRGDPLGPLLAAQGALVVLALLCSVLPKAIAWSARQHDIRRGPVGPGGTDF